MSNTSGNSPVIIKEGKAEILFSTENEVFYNKVQELNRDLSTATISTFFSHVHSTDPKIVKKSMKLLNQQDGDKDVGILPLLILEALGATGLRSIRFSKELGCKVQKIVCNDMSVDAVQAMKRNISHNACENIEPSISDATLLMCQNKGYFDVVDIDPYGTPAMFLDTAVQAVRNGGLLCITATDLSVLAGNHIQACYGKYGAMPLKRPYCHEFALRILLSCIDNHANRYSRYIKPLLSYKADFYVRVFVQVIQSQGEVQKTSSRRSFVYDCVGCHAFHLQKVGNHRAGTQHVSPGRGPPVDRTCTECGNEFYVGGPIWSESMHDKAFVRQLSEFVSNEGSYLGTAKRLQGMLTIIENELDDPLFYELSSLSKTVHSTCPPTAIFRSALLNAGFKVSQSHVHPKSVKTNAPPSFVWDVMRQWCRDQEVKIREESTVEGRILRKDMKHGVSFEKHQEAVFAYEQGSLLRFAPNPEPNWGPKARAGKRKPENSDSISDDKKKPKKKEDACRIDLKKFKCKRYEEENCDLGDSCRYSHF